VSCGYVDVVVCSVLKELIAMEKVKLEADDERKLKVCISHMVSNLYSCYSFIVWPSLGYLFRFIFLFCKIL